MLNNAISNIVFFGDSLTDTGNMSRLTTDNLVVTVPTPDSGYGAAFSNGEVYAATLAEFLETNLAGFEGADNRAIGGAHAAGTLTFQAYVDARVGAQLPPGAIYLPDADPDDLATVIDLSGQVGRYLAAPLAGDGVAVSIFAGLNDYAEFTPSSPEAALAEGTALVGAVVSSLLGSAAALAQSGAEAVILYSMPSFRLFPLSGLRPELLELGDQLVAGHNGALAAGAARLAATGVEVVTIDMNRIGAEIMADPGTFGFRPEVFGQSVLLGTGGNPVLVPQPGGGFDAIVPPNPALVGVDHDQVGFWDLVHPTGALHGVWGAFAGESLVAKTRFFGDGDDSIGGTFRRDLILAGGGDDRVLARSGNDVVLAGLGDDIVLGGRGNDILAGGGGRDILHGGDGRDVLADGAGRDTSAGGRGNDLLIDGLGHDLLSGGAGCDAFVFRAATLAGGSLAGNGGIMFGGSGKDTAYLILDDATKGAAQSELQPGATQVFWSLGLTLVDIERVVFLGPDDDPADVIKTSARLEDADLWGLV